MAKDIFKEVEHRRAKVLEQLKKAPVVDLVGIVRPGGVAGGQSQGERKWTLQIPLLAWRVGKGEVQRREMEVRQLVSERMVQRMMDRIGPWAVLRMRAQVLEENADGEPRALLQKVVDFRARDVAMGRVLAALKKPVRLRDPKLGTFTLDRGARTFEGRAKWMGRVVKVSLGGATGEGEPMAAAVARKLWAAQKVWDRKLKARMVKEYLPLYNENWRHDGEVSEPVMGKAEFLRLNRLESIAVEPDGGVSFWFKEVDMFGFHGVTVYGDLIRGLTDSELTG